MQVQFSMLAITLVVTYPVLCSPGQLAHAPYAAAVRVFANAAEEFSGAVLPLSRGQKTLKQQCQQLHIFVYVRVPYSMQSFLCLRLFMGGIPTGVKPWQSCLSEQHGKLR